jgi:hypothetical protein
MIKQILNIKIIIATNRQYRPCFTKNPSINSIYGTGFKLLDITYRSYCSILHNKTYYSDSYCCIGNFYSMSKLSKKECVKLQNYFRNYVINIALLSYFLLVILTMLVCFIIFFYLTKDPNYKFKNGIAVSIIIFLAALVIPIIVLEIYCLCKGYEMFKLLGGDFNKFSQSSFIQSVEIKNDEYDLAKIKRSNANNNYNLDNNNELTSSNIKTNNKLIDIKESNILKGKIKGVEDLIFDEKPKQIKNNKDLDEKY